MTRNRIINAVSALAFTAAVAFTPVLAQKDKGDKGMGRHGMMMGKMAKELNLSDEQKTKMKEIWANFRESSKGTREEIRKNREAIKQMMKDGSYTEGKANEILTKNSELQRQLQLAALSRMNEAKKLLTAEQQQKFEQLMEQRRSAGKDRIEKREKKGQHHNHQQTPKERSRQ